MHISPVTSLQGIAWNSSAPNAKRIFEILWGILEGRTKSALPSQPCLKNWQNGTFWSMHGIWIFLGQMTSFEVLLKCHSLTLSKKCLRLRPAPSKCLSERINWIISTIPHRISKNLFVYGSYEFLAMLEGKIREGPFSMFHYCKITVCVYSQLPFGTTVPARWWETHHIFLGIFAIYFSDFDVSWHIFHF